MLSRTPLLAPLAAAIALAVGSTAADAATKQPTSSARLQWEPGGAVCGNTIGDQGQGQTGGNDTIVCGNGLVAVAPSTAISSTVGPAITGEVGMVVTTTGNVVIVL